MGMIPKNYRMKMISNFLIWTNFFHIFFLIFLIGGTPYVAKGQINKESFSQKKKINIFQSINSAYGEIIPGLNFKGFNLGKLKFKKMEKCAKRDDFDFKFWLYFSKKMNFI